MKAKITVIIPLLLLTIVAGFYACKKDATSSINQDKYKNLDAKTAKIAQWYDNEIMDVNDRQFNRQNQADWSKLQTLVQKNGSILYALPLYQKDSLYRELNINQIEEDKFGLIKEYIVHKKKKETELKFYTINGRLIESGLLTANNLYLRKKVEKGNTIRLMGGESGFDFNDGKGDGNPLGGVTVTGPSPSTPFFIPSGPTPCNTCNYGGGGSGNGGSGGNETGGGGSSENNNDITSEFRDYPCAKALVEKMKTLNSDIANLIKATFGVNDINNINFYPDASLRGKTIDGTAGPLNHTQNSPIGTGTFQISINPDILNNSTKEYILVTLYHEALHAYFAKKLALLGQEEFNKQFQGIEVNGGRLIGVLDLEHSPMGYMKFVSGLKDAIKAFNPNFDEDRAWILAEAGILKLNAAKSKINQQERNSSEGSTGTKCPK